MAELTRAVAYTRFSSDMQREESIEAQMRAIKEFADKQGYALLKNYADRGISGTTDNRPEFQKMLDDAKKGLFDVIIVHKLDRFARNRADSAIYRKELSKNGVKLISVLENFDDSPEAIILQSVIEGYNEYYSKNLRREVMKGLKENALSCRHTGGVPCLGYDVDKKTLKLVINEYEAEAVKLIFKRYLEGEGYSSIIDELNKKGYKTKRGSLFGKNSLYEILRNEKYAGIYTYNKTAEKSENGAFNRHKSKDEKDIIRIENGVPQIISHEDFIKVQEKMHQRKKLNASYKAKQEYLLSGKILCGICGCTYAGNSRHADTIRKLYISYRCTRKNGSIKCKNPEIMREKVEKIVLNQLSEFVFNQKILPEILKKYNDYATSKNTTLMSSINSTKTKLKKIEKGIDNIVNAVMQTGSLALTEKLKELEETKACMENELQKLNIKLNSAIVDESKIKNAFIQAKKALKNGSLKNKKSIIEQYVNKVIIYPDKIEMEFKVSGDYTIKRIVER